MCEKYKIKKGSANRLFRDRKGTELSLGTLLLGMPPVLSKAADTASSSTTSSVVHVHVVVLDHWDGKQFADCCATTKPFKFVFCDHCDSGLELARCSTCYAKFASNGPS